MKFVLFVEGDTERALEDFFKRWLDPRLGRPIGIQTVPCKGWANFIKEVPVKVQLHAGRSEVIGVMGLLDFYGPDICSDAGKSIDECYRNAVRFIEEKVNCKGYRQFFAVHETEAWLFSDPNIFPDAVRSVLLKNSSPPEKVFDSGRPPAKQLEEIYSKVQKRSYKKTTDGKNLFSKLDTETAYQKCPHLKELLDEMLRIAREKCTGA